VTGDAIYPWEIAPKLSAAIRGGDELVRVYGKPGAADAKLGESWECWDATASPATIEPNDRPLIMMSLDVPLWAESGNVWRRLAPFETAIVPAAAGACAVESDEGEAAFSFVTPELPHKFLRRMLAAGVTHVTVEACMHQFAVTSTVIFVV
jgi:hypothetical protein